MQIKKIGIDEILREHINEVLTSHTIQKIDEEWEQKKQDWLNERD